MHSHETRLLRSPGRVVGVCLAVVEAVAFWAAALFPVVHLLILGTVGYGSSPAAVLPWLVGGHALAVVAGYRHEPSRWLSTDDGAGVEV